MGSIHRDIRYAVRLLGRSPMFTLVAAFSLALGIGANAALFNMFNALLWRPLPVDAPEQLVKVYSRSAKGAVFDQFPWPEYGDYASDTSFEGLAAYTITECALATPGQDAMRVYGEMVSGNYFEVLRPRMQLGRGFHADEGRTVGRDPIVVIGVAAPEFMGVFAIYFAPDVWVPIAMMPQFARPYAQILESRDDREFRFIGRLKRGGSGPDRTRSAGAFSGRYRTGRSWRWWASRPTASTGS